MNNLNVLDPTQYISNYLAELQDVVANLPQVEIRRVVELLLDVHGREGRIFLIGNGGSASTASHMANDLNKLTLTHGRKRFRAMALTDNVPLLTAWANDTDYSQVFAAQMAHFLQKGDVVIGISTSGESANVVNGLAYGQQHGATTVLFGGVAAGRCGDHADIQLLIPSVHQGIQEDCHLIFNHIIANGLREMLCVGQVSLAQ